MNFNDHYKYNVRKVTRDETFEENLLSFKLNLEDTPKFLETGPFTTATPRKDTARALNMV